MDFVVDRSKWRCGGDYAVSVGYGSTLLLNEEGFQCCLGQVSNQLGVDNQQLLNKASPATAAKSNKSVSEKLDILIMTSDTDIVGNSVMAAECMPCNDRPITVGITASEPNSREWKTILGNLKYKETRLSNYFKKQGHILKFVGNYRFFIGEKEINCDYTNQVN